MNGYAAVYEPERERNESFGGSSAETYIGTVHATEATWDGQPGPRTLCGKDASELPRVHGDIPADTFDTWYPPGGGVTTICSRCNELAT